MVHFKSKENLNFWSERPAEYVKWLKMVWVEFGCPGHGKGPWDGLGAMAKSKVTVDIMHGKERTSTGKITSAMLVTQNFRGICCNKDWDMEHADMKIQQVFVMYLHDNQISRPPAPPIVSPCKGIMSCFSFLVSWCAEALCEEVVQLLVHGMLACAWPRTRIQVLWTKSHGGRLYAHQADLLDRRRIYWLGRFIKLTFKWFNRLKVLHFSVVVASHQGELLFRTCRRVRQCQAVLMVDIFAGQSTCEVGFLILE